MRIGAIGGTYQSLSVNADAQRTQNWYCEILESDGSKAKMAMYDRPGLVLFATLPGETQVPQMFAVNSRTFAAGNSFWEVFPNGTPQNLGALTPLNGPVYVVANLNQMLISSDGKLWTFTLATSALVPVDMTQFLNGNPSVIAYVDGVFAAVIKDTNIVYFSNLLDGATWDQLDAIEVSKFPEKVISFVVDHGEPILLGQKHSLPYYNSGQLTNQFAPNPSSGVIEQGCAAEAAVSQMDNTVHVLGRDKLGSLIAYRANGYTPQRISNHCVERFWQGYAVSSDAVSYTLQMNGHLWWVIYFPIVGATWCYDGTTQMWTEWTSTDAHGKQGAFLGMSYCNGFDKHLLGGISGGKIYEMREDAYTDAGAPIVRLRRFPHISTEMQYQYLGQLLLDVESGTGPMPPLVDGSGNPRDPQISMRQSNDGGHTYGQSKMRSFGQAGKYKTRVYWNRLGRTRDCVFEISCSEPVPCRLIDAYLNPNPPTERLATQVRKGA